MLIWDEIETSIVVKYFLLKDLNNPKELKTKKNDMYILGNPKKLTKSI